MNPSFQIKDIKLVFSWNLNLTSNTDCTICHCNLNTNSVYNEDSESTIIKGNCSHCFHAECITPWVTKNNNCPICNTVWIKAETITKSLK